MHIRGLWEEKGSSDTRLLEALLIPDELTVVGRSYAENATRREHVVPRLVIVKECHQMLEREQSDEALAKLIRDNTRIVLISKEESERLDRVDQTNHRQTMPAGWKFGDDPFARLKKAEIEWARYPGPPS
ncbi:hypothetical protein [Caulobacter sp.]|uniref:hypothetical protein n=1 Tax=Caulobacter sp. TaxID=78 RepID=UPI003BAC8510